MGWEIRAFGGLNFSMKVLAIWICKFKLINCKKIAPKMHQNSPFWAQKSKNFLAYPPQRLRRLDLRAYGAIPRPQGRLPKIRANLVLPPPQMNHDRYAYDEIHANCVFLWTRVYVNAPWQSVTSRRWRSAGVSRLSPFYLYQNLLRSINIQGGSK